MEFQDVLEDEVPDEGADAPTSAVAPVTAEAAAAPVVAMPAAVVAARSPRWRGATIGVMGAMVGAVVALVIAAGLSPATEVQPLALSVDEAPILAHRMGPVVVPRQVLGPPTPSPSPVGDGAIHAGQVAGAALVSRPALMPHNAPRAGRRDTTFAGVMAGLTSKVEGCVTSSALERKPYTVQVRFLPGSGEVDMVRVARLDQQHDFTRCVDQLVRRARPPIGDSPIESFTFFADQTGK